MNIYNAYGWWNGPAVEEDGAAYSTFTVSLVVTNEGALASGTSVITVSASDPWADFELDVDWTGPVAGYQFSVSGDTFILQNPAGLAAGETITIDLPPIYAVDHAPGTSPEIGELLSFSVNSTAPDGAGGTTIDAFTFELLAGPPAPPE